MALVSNKGYTYGRILVDDWPPYIDAWLKHRPRGKVIMPAHEYNLGCYEGNPNVVRYTGDDESHALALSTMQEAFDRKDIVATPYGPAEVME